MIGTSSGQTYEDGLDHLNDIPMEGPKPLPSENTKQPDQPIVPLDKKGPMERKMREEHIRDILAPGVPQGPTDKAIIPGQTAPTYHPDQEKTFPNTYTINTDHNVLSGAVASKHSDVVYIDPKIDPKFYPFLATHEETEKHLMAGGMPYARAHVYATLAEKHEVEQAGMGWKDYTDAIDPEVAKAEKGSGKNPPPDPHVNIGDAIGHHADKASTLEKADIKIGSDIDERPIAGQKYAMEDTRRIVPEGPGRASGGGSYRSTPAYSKEPAAPPITRAGPPVEKPEPLTATEANKITKSPGRYSDEKVNRAVEFWKSKIDSNDYGHPQRNQWLDKKRNLENHLGYIHDIKDIPPIGY